MFAIKDCSLLLRFSNSVSRAHVHGTIANSARVQRVRCVLNRRWYTGRMDMRFVDKP